MVGGAYIVDFPSVVVICRCVHDTAEAGEKPLRKRVERVASHLFLNFALTRGCMEAAVGGLHVFPENLLSYNGLVRNRESFLKSILLHPSVVPAEIPRQY